MKLRSRARRARQARLMNVFSHPPATAPSGVRDEGFAGDAGENRRVRLQQLAL